MDTLVSSDIVQFGNFRLDRRRGRLLRRDDRGVFAPVPVGSRALELLRVLIDHAGEVVSKHDIMHGVCPGTAVEDSNLTVQLSTLRRVLDAGRPEGSCTQTVPGRGYRFVEKVAVRVDPVGEPSAPPSTVMQRYGEPAVTEHLHLLRAGRRAAWQARFDRVKALQAEGRSRSAIVRATGFNWRTVAKWVRLDALPVRRTMEPNPTTPMAFRAYLARRWAEGCTMGR